MSFGGGSRAVFCLGFGVLRRCGALPGVMVISCGFGDLAAVGVVLLLLLIRVFRAWADGALWLCGTGEVFSGRVA